jgi:sialate O-acetylesterase
MRIARQWLPVCIIALFVQTAVADVKLPAILGDHMVLQRDQPIIVWGWDDPGTNVVVVLNDVKSQVRTGQDGRWQAELPAQRAGGPFKMTVTGSSTKELQDVLIGEVWLASGQSNMEWTVTRSDHAEAEIAAGSHPQIRHIKIPHTPAATVQQDVSTDGWQQSSSDTVGSFTAVGYFFARCLQKELDVPVGIIGSNRGGTRITPPVGFQQVPALADIANNLDEYPAKKNDGGINHQSPLALYNGMIAPLVPYGIRGALWYQGESNNGEGMLYHEKM